MAYASQHSFPSQTRSFFLRAGTILATIGTTMAGWLDSLAKANSRIAKIEALSAMTDEQLAAKGLRREDIARYVFRDYMAL